MKIQGLAIIFIIIILPITIIVGEYARTQIEIIRREQLYDSRLITATDDALKAFQINSFNDANSETKDRKRDLIEKSVNVFYNSMESSFGLQGYSREDLQMYVPALVFTMYDGYYIYAPYTDIVTDDGNLATGTERKIEYGLKPYVYYSCRYQMGDKYDFVINYSLDNYITVQGLVDGQYVYKSGYLLTVAENADSNIGVYYDESSGLCEYNGISILPEVFDTTGLVDYIDSSLEDTILEKKDDGSIGKGTYKYIKINGDKYYWDASENKIFRLVAGKRNYQSDYQAEKIIGQIQKNTSGIAYYRDAYYFSKWVKDNLSNIKIENSAIKDRYQNTNQDVNIKIFDFDPNNKIEYSSSNFNLHKKEVIRAAIETNLSVAIANFNNYTNSGNDFQMPQLKETDWELLQNEVSIISFLQGMNLGGKIYNGYSVVTNSKTEEVVKEERILITTADGYYHKINDTHFQKDGEYEDASKVQSGVFDLDFEVRKDALTGNSYIYREQLGCYTSVVGQNNLDTTYDSIYEYLDKANVEDEIKRIYYTALGRERWGTFKIERKEINPDAIIDGMLKTSSNSDETLEPGGNVPSGIKAMTIRNYSNKLKIKEATGEPYVANGIVIETDTSIYPGDVKIKTVKYIWSEDVNQSSDEGEWTLLTSPDGKSTYDQIYTYYPWTNGINSNIFYLHLYLETDDGREETATLEFTFNTLEVKLINNNV